MVLNRDKLAEVLGCSVRTIDDYVRQGMPGEPPKHLGDQWRFDPAASVDWLRERERKAVLGDIAKINETEARRRKLAAEAALAELEYAKADGSVVAIGDFAKAWSQMIGSARAKLLGLGSKLGPAVAITEDAAECNALIDGSVAEALQELSECQISIEPERDREAESGVPEVPNAVGPPSRPHNKRVGRSGKKAVKRKQR
jgi:Tfp pilus assembly protein FimV